MIQILKPMTEEDASAKLREIFSDLQTRFHDQWEWMEADFALLVLEEYLRQAREDSKQCALLHGDNEGLIAHYRDQLILERGARKRAEVEQFNAGLEAAAKMLEEHASISGSTEMDCAADMVRSLAKPQHGL